MNDILTDILGHQKSELKFKVGLYFGTFNPIHIGHMAIANYMVEFTPIEQLWFVVSPQNPHKQKKNLLNDYDRLELVHRAVDNETRIRVTDIEFNMPKPSYTSDTLAWLTDKYPTYEFYIIMGSDNLENFHKWKNHETIINNYGIIVYPRPGTDQSKYNTHKNIIFTEAPQMEISSTFIRKAIKEGKDIRHFLPNKTWEYIDEMGFYR
ncbi:MAG TPA: nicotinate (nicotinamide) nucleotide adenylyltransferase [Prolixibacteraceae bacterium]|nr:nicotinate (nicotinamide) nucleotide adenylyltransferase [Prolixibacteraceae bacterium]